MTQPQLEKKTKKRGLYLMPGMAASPRIFEFIDLTDSFDVVHLSWITPKFEEPIEDYALRMCERVHHQDPILLGVSFGVIMVQEMSKHIHCNNFQWRSSYPTTIRVCDCRLSSKSIIG